MEYFGLLFEFLFLALGVSVYLFSKGWFTPQNISSAKSVNEFRENNKSWMRIIGLALTAIMIVNIIIHMQQLI